MPREGRPGRSRSAWSGSPRPCGSGGCGGSVGTDLGQAPAFPIVVAPHTSWGPRPGRGRAAETGWAAVSAGEPVAVGFSAAKAGPGSSGAAASAISVNSVSVVRRTDSAMSAFPFGADECAIGQRTVKAAVTSSVKCPPTASLMETLNLAGFVVGEAGGS